MKKFFLIITLILIASLGLYLRYDSFKHKHPDQDELFELHSITKDLSLGRVLDRTSFYGDHTSYPGEFLMYQIPLRVLDKDIGVDVGQMKVTGMVLSDFWVLAVPKIIITVLGFICLIWLWRSSPVGILGLIMYSCNPHLVYHAFEMRAYGVLPELAIFNLMLCGFAFKRVLYPKYIRISLSLLYALLFFVTCTYHAYGILIAGLPLLYYSVINKKISFGFLPVAIISIACWSYYASNNTFGWTPNAVQTQSDTFQYMPADGFFLRVFSALTGGGVIMYSLASILLLRL